ncbi:hypothetical protein [Paenibacillus chitinolyticus]|uniref:hypothetical protein n=1 Tax=Paenibacillus chitinolyticus TaxID=79263 RepID=UPI003672ABD5
MEHVKKPYTGPVYTPKQTGPMPQAVAPMPMPMPMPMPLPAPMPMPLPYPGPLPSPVIHTPPMPIVKPVIVVSCKPHYPVCHPIKPIAKKCRPDNSASILVLFILLVIISSGFGYAKKC